MQPENWAINYERVLVRDVKTISQVILMVKASAVGGDLLLEGNPVDVNHQTKIANKIISEKELTETVFSEGWEISYNEYTRRKVLSLLILDKLKLVAADNDPEHDQRIELYSFIESKMLMITRAAFGQEHEQDLGSVEISSHHTLTDLRVIIKHELDNDDLPTQYRFLYKGTVCSLRQETFRRAWECLPTCYITPKAVVTNEIGTETDDIAKRRLDKPVKKEGPKIPRLTKSQRRVPGKWTPIPLPTLCIVEEGKAIVYLLTEAKELLSPGDIIRIGNPKGRDYIVTKIGTPIKRSLAEEDEKANELESDTNLKSIEIEPEYDLIGEPDFQEPTWKNFPYPVKNVGLFMNEKGQLLNLLKSKEQVGYNYQLPEELASIVYPDKKPDKKKKKKKRNETMDKLLRRSSANISSLTLLITEGGEEGEGEGGVTEKKDGTDNKARDNDDEDDDEEEEEEEMERQMTPSHVRNKRKEQIKMLHSSPSEKSSSNLKKAKTQKNLGFRIIADVWIWKCIPQNSDNRPKWKQLYDDGEIRYSYEFTQSEEFFEHFRVKSYYSYLEILCTDSRCSYLSMYSQRVNEMKLIPLEYYTKLIFDKMTDWSPMYKKGIERTKFIKLIRDVNAFPDIKRPARLAQIDNAFQKMVKSSYGIVQKYITYPGFVQLVKELAVLRFPPKKNKDSAAANQGPNILGNEPTANKDKDKDKDNDKDDDQSVMTDDMSSVNSDGDHKKRGGRRPLHATKRPTITIITTMEITMS